MSNNKKNNIFIFDDDIDNIMLIDNVLKRHYNVYYSQNHNTALDILDKIEIDMILLDVVMPEIDGYEFLDLLKSTINLSETPVIFLTSKTDKESIIKGLECGAVDYISKPFEEMELLYRIRNHIDLKNAKKEISKKNEELIGLINTKNKLLAVIAHDLKNPLGNIKEFLKLIINKEVEEKEVDEILGSVYEASCDTYDLLQNLVQWSLFNEKTKQINFEKCNIKKLIDESIQNYRILAIEKKINIINSVDENISLKIDKNMILTCIRNLLSNAIKYTRNNGHIKIVSKVDKNINISIIDNGVGMTKKRVEEISNSSFNKSIKGTNFEAGTGLGLNLCKEFLKKNNGTLNIESEVNKGTKFTMVFRNEKV